MNKLYRKYAILATVATILFLGFHLLASFLEGTSYPLVADISIRADGDNSYKYMTEIYRDSAIIAWGILVFLFTAVRGFARAQVFPNDASAVRTISYGVLLFIISHALSYVTWVEVQSPNFPFVWNLSHDESLLREVWYIFHSLINFAGIITAFIGFIRLAKSKFQSTGARIGIILIIIMLVINLLSSISSRFCTLLLWGCDPTEIYGSLLSAYTYLIIEFNKLISALVWVLTIIGMIIGAFVICVSKNMVSNEECDAICKANDDATSMPHTLRVWLYCMAAVCTLEAFYALFMSLYYTGVYNSMFLENAWVFKLYHSTIGDRILIPTPNTFALKNIAIIALSIWMLCRRSVRNHIPTRIGLIGMICISLVTIPAFVISIANGYYSVTSAHHISYTLCCLIDYDIVFLMMILIFTWCTKLNKFIKIAISACIIPLLCTHAAPCVMGIYGNWNNMPYDYFLDKEIIYNTYNWGLSFYVIIPIVLLICATSSTLGESKRWVKGATIAIATLLSIFTIYANIKIFIMM